MITEYLSWVNCSFKWADIQSAYLCQMSKEIKHMIKVIIYSFKFLLKISMKYLEYV